MKVCRSCWLLTCFGERFLPAGVVGDTDQECRLYCGRLPFSVRPVGGSLKGCVLGSTPSVLSLVADMLGSQPLARRPGRVPGVSVLLPSLIQALALCQLAFTTLRVAAMSPPN